MKYTFLGHQSWIFEEGRTKILMDPLLEDTFGFESKHGIEVVPPRTINKKIYEDADAVLLSHEHSDHFHPASLKHLKKGLTVYVGVLTLAPVIWTLREMGFNVVKVKSGETITIGDLTITFFQAHPKTVIWESRVYQFLFVSNVTKYSIFVAVDALISKDFENALKIETIAPPDTIMVSNNSQIPPRGAFSSMDNVVIPERENPARNGPLGLKLVKAIIVDYSDIVHDLEHIILCGGGFMKSGDVFGEFMMSNQMKVAALAAPIFPEKNIQGATPGMSFTDGKLNGGIESGITANEKRSKELSDKFEAFRANPVWDLHSIEEIDPVSFFDTCDRIVRAFDRRYQTIIVTDIGRILVSSPNPTSCFELDLEDDRSKQRARYSLNIISGTWSRCDGEMKRPFGIRAMVADFSAMLDGNLQIWDCAGLSIATWYDPSLGNSIKYSPMGMLYAVFGEHFNVTQFQGICERMVDELNYGDLV